MPSRRNGSSSRRLERQGRQVRQRAAVQAMHDDVVRFCQELSMAIDLFMRTSAVQVEHDMTQLLANLGALADLVSDRGSGGGRDTAESGPSTSDGAGTSSNTADAGPSTSTGRINPIPANRAPTVLNRGTFWRRVAPGQPDNVPYGPLRFAFTLRRPTIRKNDWYMALSARTLAKRQQEGLCAEESNCCICLEPLDGPIRQPITCKHVFHGECIDKWFKSSPLLRPRCPICRLHFKSRAEHAREKRFENGRKGGGGSSGLGGGLAIPAAR